MAKTFHWLLFILTFRNDTPHEVKDDKSNDCKSCHFVLGIKLEPMRTRTLIAKVKGPEPRCRVIANIESRTHCGHAVEFYRWKFSFQPAGSYSLASDYSFSFPALDFHYFHLPRSQERTKMLVVSLRIVMCESFFTLGTHTGYAQTWIKVGRICAWIVRLLVKSMKLGRRVYFMCLSNVDMEPSRNIMGCRDISGIQDSHQLKPEVRNFKPEVV